MINPEAALKSFDEFLRKQIREPASDTYAKQGEIKTCNSFSKEESVNGKEQAIKLLQAEIKKLEKKIA